MFLIMFDCSKHLQQSLLSYATWVILFYSRESFMKNIRLNQANSMLMLTRYTSLFFHILIHALMCIKFLSKILR